MEIEKEGKHHVKKSNLKEKNLENISEF